MNDASHEISLQLDWESVAKASAEEILEIAERLISEGWLLEDVWDAILSVIGWVNHHEASAGVNTAEESDHQWW